MKLKYRCLISGCDFDSETRIGLQKHYEQDHTYAERANSSLVLSGGEYLPLTHRGHSEDVRKKLAAIMMLVCGLMMITAHLPVNFAVAADEGGSGGGGDNSGDSGGGGDSGSNDGGGDSGGSKDDSGGGGEDKQESSSSNDGEDTQQGTSEDGKESNDAPQDDQKKEKEWTGSHRSIDQGSPLDDRFKEAREKEKAAVEDYIHEEPGIVKPYPPVKDKPYISVKPGTVFDKPKHVGSPYLGKGGDGNGQSQPQGTSGNGNNDSCNYYGKNICEGSADGKTCNDEKFDCLSEYKDETGKYQNCPTGQCPNDDKPYHPGGGSGGGEGKGEGDWCEQHKDKCGDGGHGGGKGGKDHDHHSHGDHDHHHNHDHNYHNDHHYHNHNDNKYYYYYSNDYSNNHATVILQLDYHGSNNHDNIRLEIGNDFDTVINFAGEPEDLVVTGLDLDEGEHFDVCLENEDSNEVNCVSTQIYDEDKAVYVDIRVPA